MLREHQLTACMCCRSVYAALGLAATSLLATQQADAASEVMQLAERDLRLGVVGLLFLPVLGWVGFNIGNFCPQLKATSAPTPLLSMPSMQGAPPSTSCRRWPRAQPLRAPQRRSPARGAASWRW